MSQYLGKVGMDVRLHYEPKTLSFGGLRIPLHAASTFFAHPYQKP